MVTALTLGWLVGLLTPDAHVAPTAEQNARCGASISAFDDWERAQPDPRTWVCDLPRCPDILPVSGTTTVLEKAGFRKLRKANRFHQPLGKRIHRATRSNRSANDHGMQCVYTRDGSGSWRILSGTLMDGSADFGAAYHPSAHLRHDVRSWKLAAHLDENCGGGELYRRRYYALRPGPAMQAKLCGT